MVLCEVLCEAELCIYNKDFRCTLDQIEIESSGECCQRMTVSLSEEELGLIPEEALALIKQEYLKNEKELWEKRIRKQ